MTVAYIGDKVAEPAGPQDVIRSDSDRGETILDPKLSQKLWNHSPDGFQWGYGGSGPAQLALAILLDVTKDDRVSIALYQSFKMQKIQGLGDRFIITAGEVRDWVRTMGG